MNLVDNKGVIVEQRGPRKTQNYGLGRLAEELDTLPLVDLSLF